MTTLTPETFDDVLENRWAWIRFLKEPGRKKTTRRLEELEDPERRCCLGHLCHVMGVSRAVSNGGVRYDNYMVALPNAVLDAVGMWSNYGSFRAVTPGSLARMNDHQGLSPHKIGEYLESVVAGGGNTPFMTREDWEERQAR